MTVKENALFTSIYKYSELMYLSEVIIIECIVEIMTPDSRL